MKLLYQIAHKLRVYLEEHQNGIAETLSFVILAVLLLLVSWLISTSLYFLAN
jgi:hypothetical protein